MSGSGHLKCGPSRVTQNPWPDTALEFTNRKESKESIEIIKRSPQVS